MQSTGQTRMLLIAVAGLVVGAVLYFATRPAPRDDKDPALAALDRAETKKELSKLREMLKSPDSRVASRALGALVNLAGRAAKPDLEPLLQDPRADVRAVAAGLYGTVTDRNGAQPLLDLIKTERDPNVRAAAASSLGVCQSWDGMPVLISMLDDANTNVRIRACESINRIIGLRVDFSPAGPAVDRRRVMDQLRNEMPKHKHGYDLRWKDK